MAFTAIPAAFAAARTALAGQHELALRTSATLAAGALVVAGSVAAASAVAGRRPVGGERAFAATLLGSALVGGCVSAAFTARLLGSLRRVADGDRAAPDEVLRVMATRLTRAVPLDELVTQLCESLVKRFELVNAELWKLSGTDLRLAASVPHRAADRHTVDPRGVEVASRTAVAGSQWLGMWLAPLAAAAQRSGGPMIVAPLVHAGTVVGLLVCDRRADGFGFDDAEQHTIVSLARSFALALHNAELDHSLTRTLTELQAQSEELRASRTRIVAASDEVRRRIERDLHDGAQQHLVALALNLRTARNLARAEPGDQDALYELLGELAAEASTAAAEVRDLAHGVYPPLLRESGIAAALQASLVRSRQLHSMRAVEGRFDRGVEAAVYFACLEGLQNVAKHAPGANADVVIEVASSGAGDELCFCITDDGPGLRGATTNIAGHGRENVRDRLGAIGGWVRWDDAPGGGTRMSGGAPLSTGEDRHGSVRSA